MNALIKDALKLVIITVVAGLVLGAVYGITKGPIADQEAKAQMEAYKTVFPRQVTLKKLMDFPRKQLLRLLQQTRIQLKDMTVMLFLPQ